MAYPRVCLAKTLRIDIDKQLYLVDRYARQFGAILQNLTVTVPQCKQSM